MPIHYRYFQAGEKRFCFDIRPTFRCPLAEAAPDPADEGTPTVSLALRAAAEDLACDAVLLGKLLSRAHRSLTAGRLRVNGRLTNSCSICGSHMRRLGFGCWIEEKPIEEKPTHEDVQARIIKRLGGTEWRAVPGRWYRGRLSEAREWARGRAKEIEAGST
jgi:hypothetical protein